MRTLAGLLGVIVAIATIDATYGAEHDTRENQRWPRHVIQEGHDCRTAIASDMSGDGIVDIVSNYDGHTRLILGPDFKKQVILDETHDVMHSQFLDVDADGDLDYVGAVFDKGPVFWLEHPEDPLADSWPRRIVDGAVTGIHGLFVADIDDDGQPDLVGNSSLQDNPYPESLIWWKVPQNPHRSREWIRNVFADRDAPGRSHYMGAGDLNGDGRIDVAAAAKDSPQGNWFAWWEQPTDPTKSWTKHMLAENEHGASNILPADVNGDGVMDLVATRGHGKGVLWFEGPKFEQHQINTEIEGPHNLALADIDRDGDLDAATASKISFVTAWFENDGSGNFQTHSIFEDQGGYDIRLVDLDGDQDLDVLVSGEFSLNLVWFENRLSGDGASGRD